MNKDKKKKWWKFWKNPGNLVDVLIYVKGLQSMVDFNKWCPGINCPVTDKFEKLRNELKASSTQETSRTKYKDSDKKTKKSIFSKFINKLQNL